MNSTVHTLSRPAPQILSEYGEKYIRDNPDNVQLSVLYILFYSFFSFFFFYLKLSFCLTSWAELNSI